jgi:hypothetical protein
MWEIQGMAHKFLKTKHVINDPQCHEEQLGSLKRFSCRFELCVSSVFSIFSFIRIWLFTNRFKSNEKSATILKWVVLLRFFEGKVFYLFLITSESRRGMREWEVKKNEDDERRNWMMKIKNSKNWHKWPSDSVREDLLRCLYKQRICAWITCHQRSRALRMRHKKCAESSIN